MKLFSLRLTTLKSKLYAIVFASFVVRVVAFFALPNTASNLAPDEGNYGALAEWIAQGKPADEYSYSHLYKMSRSLIIPASVLCKIGLSGVMSVRIISLIYGVLILGLIAYALITSKDFIQKLFKLDSKNQAIVVVLFSAFAFAPSHLIWAVLGLRESATEFWTVSTFLTLLLIQSGQIKRKVLGFGIMFLSIVFTFTSRPQVGWVLVVTLLIYSGIIIRSKTGVLLFLTLILSLPVIVNIGSTDTTIESPKSSSNFLEQQINKQNYHSAMNRENAESAIPEIYCPFDGTGSIKSLACLTWRTPYAVYTFLFRPIISHDVTNSATLFAALENMAWLAILLFTTVMTFRNRRLAYFSELAPSVMFGAIYSVAAGTYEGNMGTAFRHKSLILWVVILLLASTIVATQQRRAEQQGISGSSQE